MEKGKLKRKAWATLEYLMTSLMLGGEFDIILEAAKQKEKTDTDAKNKYKMSPEEFEKKQDERLIKTLLRCLRMYEVK